ncbi:arginine repressor [Acetatifactor aquisgranensis]|uniref:arginine repressor n=1 Tax=Acetatifactor aquisgranensis TaxID=2941233 RepID=UPI00203E9284|nr:arginine repressor [Acetatifactor aquisgranensis]MCI8544375.1 arginine repressor [Lachnospiraceae bacterium]
MKVSRQERMIEIIRKYEVGTQEELAERLREAGFSVTQATVSRDIRELKLSKVPTAEGGQKYVVLEQEEGQQGDRFIRVLRDAFSSMEAAQNLLVVRTVSGMAMAAAAALDALKFPEVVGCIAGDDTIFVATHTLEEARALMDKIESVTA